MPTSCRTRAAIASVLLLLIASPSARAFAADAPAPGEDYQKIQAEHQAAMQEFITAYSAAKTPDERQKLFSDKYPDAQKYAKRMLAFAEASPKHANAVDALVWVATNTQDGDAHNGALGMLADEPYVQSEKLAQAAPRLAYSQSPKAADVLKAMAEKNPSPQVKGVATFSLAQHYKDRNKSEEAERLFEEVAAKYAEVASYRGTLGEAAKANLHEIRDLAIGKVAPEIEGEDVDGKTFKLSEYRGKVVVLDFWGDW